VYGEQANKYAVMAEHGSTSRYSRRFARLRRDVSRVRWSEVTLNGAPHKPLLLLSVLDLFEQGQVRSGLIELNPDLGELFTRYWTRIMPPDRRGNLALPFFHLRGDSFWHLVPKPGKQGVLEDAAQIRSLARLQDAVIGTRLDDKLYGLLRAQGARDVLRSVLIETFFRPNCGPRLSSKGP
jgi:putative restriction endonuclease